MLPQIYFCPLGTRTLVIEPSKQCPIQLDCSDEASPTIAYAFYDPEQLQCSLEMVAGYTARVEREDAPPISLQAGRPIPLLLRDGDRVEFPNGVSFMLFQPGSRASRLQSELASRGLSMLQQEFGTLWLSGRRTIEAIHNIDADFLCELNYPEDQRRALMVEASQLRECRNPKFRERVGTTISRTGNLGAEPEPTKTFVNREHELYTWLKSMFDSWIAQSKQQQQQPTQQSKSQNKLPVQLPKEKNSIRVFLTSKGMGKTTLLVNALHQVFVPRLKDGKSTVDEFLANNKHQEDLANRFVALLREAQLRDLIIGVGADLTVSRMSNLPITSQLALNACIMYNIIDKYRGYSLWHKAVGWFDVPDMGFGTLVTHLSLLYREGVEMFPFLEAIRPSYNHQPNDERQLHEVLALMDPRDLIQLFLDLNKNNWPSTLEIGTASASQQQPNLPALSDDPLVLLLVDEVQSLERLHPKDSSKTMKTYVGERQCQVPVDGVYDFFDKLPNTTEPNCKFNLLVSCAGTGVLSSYWAISSTRFATVPIQMLPFGYQHLVKIVKDQLKVDLNDPANHALNNAARRVFYLTAGVPRLIGFLVMAVGEQARNVQACKDHYPELFRAVIMGATSVHYSPLSLWIRNEVLQAYIILCVCIGARVRKTAPAFPHAILDLAGLSPEEKQKHAEISWGELEAWSLVFVAAQHPDETFSYTVPFLLLLSDKDALATAFSRLMANDDGTETVRLDWFFHYDLMIDPRRLPSTAKGSVFERLIAAKIWGTYKYLSWKKKQQIQINDIFPEVERMDELALKGVKVLKNRWTLTVALDDVLRDRNYVFLNGNGAPVDLFLFPKDCKTFIGLQLKNEENPISFTNLCAEIQKTWGLKEFTREVLVDAFGASATSNTTTDDSDSSSRSRSSKGKLLDTDNQCSCLIVFTRAIPMEYLKKNCTTSGLLPSFTHVNTAFDLIESLKAKRMLFIAQPSLSNFFFTVIDQELAVALAKSTVAGKSLATKRGPAQEADEEAAIVAAGSMGTPATLANNTKIKKKKTEKEAIEHGKT